MKTLNKISILFLVFASVLLSSCALGGNVFKENDGFSGKNVKQNTIANTYIKVNRS